MRKRIKNLYITLFLISIILTFIGFFNKNITDINIHDTYYVFETAALFYISAIITSFVGLVFWIILITKKQNE